MAKVPPPRGKGEPPPPDDTVGNLDKGETAHLGFRVRKQFKKEFNLFAIEHDYRSQADLLYEAFELVKQKHQTPE